jgi:fatty-acyl-CoA synthase
MLFRHGATVHAESEVVTLDEPTSRRATFADVAADAARLAGGLRRLGVQPGDCVGTLAWNTQEHVAAYFAVPGMGAVLHTLNLRLFPEQLTYVVNDARDRVVIVDDAVVPVLARVAGALSTVERFIVVGDGPADTLAHAAPRAEVLRYDELVSAEGTDFEWPDVDERSAAATCYTSGTTGNPKGVVYTHRSTFLHAMAVCTTQAMAISNCDRVLLVVPMFHANAWGLPYAAWIAGADLLLPARHLQPDSLARFIAQEHPTFAGAVPTIWSELLRYGDAAPDVLDLSSFRMIVCGGSAVPRHLIESFEQRYGVRIVQAWGMTETSPLAAVAHPPRGVPAGSVEEMDWRVKTGRVIPGVELRIVADDGTVLAWDGESVGEIEVRGPWVTAAYAGDPAPEKFDRGWLRTGDVGTVDARGYLQITDRAKDVIKSGGEWISSVELENLLMGHGDVVEAVVIGVPDPRWDERPLACVVRVAGSAVSATQLREFLGQRLARWQVPDYWAFIDEIPKTSVGKFDKKQLRSLHADGLLAVEGATGKPRPPDAGH